MDLCQANSILDCLSSEVCISLGGYWRNTKILQLGRILGSEISRRCHGGYFKIPKDIQIDIMEKMEQDIFGTLKEILPNSRIAPEMAPLLRFLNLHWWGVSTFGLKPGLANMTTALKAHTAAEVAKCQQALDWLEIITNGDLSVHEQTSIRTLINNLGKSMDETGFTKRMENFIADEIEVLKNDFYKRVAQYY